MGTTTLQITMSRAKDKEIDALEDFLCAVEVYLNENWDDETELVAIARKAMSVISTSRITFGYRTLVENACDLTKSHLAWKPEIQQLLDAASYKAGNS